MIPHKDCAMPPTFGLYHSPLQNAPIFQERTDVMPAYYDEKAKSWYCKFYYTDYTGTKKQKKKRGFKLQREAKEWERNFLETQQADLSMTFENFVKIYYEDMKHRLREHTLIQKQYVIDKKLLPFFGKLPVSQITPAHVRKWQNSLISYRDKNEFHFSTIRIKKEPIFLVYSRFLGSFLFIQTPRQIA